MKLEAYCKCRNTWTVKAVGYDCPECRQLISLIPQVTIVYDELPEDVRANLPIGDHIPPRTDQIMPALEALWRHIKPEAKR